MTGFIHTTPVSPFPLPIRSGCVFSVPAPPVAQTCSLSVSQVFNLPPTAREQPSADYKSAIRQIKNLRYAKRISEPGEDQGEGQLRLRLAV